jgi:hypothetical protein
MGVSQSFLPRGPWNWDPSDQVGMSHWHYGWCKIFAIGIIPGCLGMSDFTNEAGTKYKHAVFQEFV